MCSFGWAIIFIQLLNLLGMQFTYSKWTPDHTIAIIACAIIFIGIHCLRYSKNFAVYGVVVLLLCTGTTLASALPDGTGVNSALLPFVVMAPMLNAFIAGPRVAVATGAASALTIAFLYYWSVEHPIAANIYYDPRNTQRAIQAIFATFIVTAIAGAFSANIFRAFRLLEANVRRARAAEQAKSRFLARMSHELRTPLNGVVGLAEALQETPLANDQKDIVDNINTSGQSILSVVSNILDLSNIDAGAVELNERDFEPRQLCREIGDTWRGAAIAKGLHFHVGVAQDVPDRLCGDDQRIRQIMSNLVSNAVKFTETGAISILMNSTTENGDWLELIVTDTGKGVPQETQSDIFQAFEQADSATTRLHDGAGLGLTISRRLARLMGGELTLESDGATGAKLTVRLPRKVADSDTLTEQYENRKDDSLTDEVETLPLKALLVEDNTVNQMVAGRLLQSLKIGFDVASDGAEAVIAFEQSRYDFVLMDKHMPNMNGVDAMHAIRRLGQAGRIAPIIACTADAVAGEREALLQAGFSAFVAKPISKDALAAAIEQAVDQPSKLPGAAA
ncbi:MAG: ATP-binding protein [Pseudomonadota bacterium]